MVAALNAKGLGWGEKSKRLGEKLGEHVGNEEEKWELGGFLYSLGGVEKKA